MLRGGVVHFSFVLVAFGFLYCFWLFVGIWPLGNKLLLIKTKRKKLRELMVRETIYSIHHKQYIEVLRKHSAVS